MVIFYQVFVEKSKTPKKCLFLLSSSDFARRVVIRCAIEFLSFCSLFVLFCWSQTTEDGQNSFLMRRRTITIANVTTTTSVGLQAAGVSVAFILVVRAKGVCLLLRLTCTYLHILC